MTPGEHTMSTSHQLRPRSRPGYWYSSSRWAARSSEGRSTAEVSSAGGAQDSRVWSDHAGTQNACTSTTIIYGERLLCGGSSCLRKSPETVIAILSFASKACSQLQMSADVSASRTDQEPTSIFSGAKRVPVCLLRRIEFVRSIACLPLLDLRDPRQDHSMLSVERRDVYGCLVSRKAMLNAKMEHVLNTVHCASSAKSRQNEPASIFQGTTCLNIEGALSCAIFSACRLDSSSLTYHNTTPTPQPASRLVQLRVALHLVSFAPRTPASFSPHHPSEHMFVLAESGHEPLFQKPRRQA